MRATSTKIDGKERDVGLCALEEGKNVTCKIDAGAAGGKHIGHTAITVDCSMMDPTVRESAEDNSSDDSSSIKKGNESVDMNGADERSSCCNDQLKKMRNNSDWWSLYVGLASFGLAVVLVFTVPYGRSVVPGPSGWDTNPLDAWDMYSFFGTWILIGYFCMLYILAVFSMGRLHAVSQYVVGFLVIGLVATLSLWIGRNKFLAKNGLSYAIWSLVFGMMVTNSPLGDWKALSCLKLVSKDGEFFIKCSLALLATEFSVLAEVGLPAIVVGWIGSPVALVMGYLACRRLFKMETEISLLTAVGATWCGASAISATGSVVEASSSNITLSISVVAFFTIIFTFVQPYFAIGIGMNDEIAGAWIGGSVDQTGNVIASAAIISEEATEVAAIVKLILNSGLGILCSCIAFWWQTQTNKNGKKFSWIFLWDKFPKFVLGYFFCSGVLTVVLPHLEGSAEANSMQRAVIDMNKWWFAIGFVGIGIQTNLKEMWRGAIGSGVIQGYLLTNMFDIGISLGLSYAMFRM